MPDLALEEIVTKIRDLLRDDARTKDWHWHTGVQTLLGLPRLPAGGISIGASGEGFAATAPLGLQVEVPILIRLRTASTEGVAKAEQSIQDIIGKIIDVLWAKRNLDINRVMNVRFTTSDMEGNAEAQPPAAEGELTWWVTVRQL